MNAINITGSGFTAKWEPISGINNYQIDISSENFASFVLGFNAKDVTGSSLNVTGLQAEKEYQYRLKAVNEGGVSDNSNVIFVQTITGLEDEILSRGTSILPNPSQGLFNLIIETPEQSDVISYFIYDAVGKVILNSEIVKSTIKVETLLDLNEAQNGVYIILINSKKRGTISKRIIKQ